MVESYSFEEGQVLGGGVLFQESEEDLANRKKIGIAALISVVVGTSVAMLLLKDHWNEIMEGNWAGKSICRGLARKHCGLS